jgi:glycerophosphoryl diester phosphodiesterase
MCLVAAVALLVGACSDDGTEASGDSDTTTTTAAAIPKPDATTVDATLALDRPVILAHAGGENAYPHSTPYAYAESVKAGVDILDFDVQLSADGVLVVQHDDDVDRTTNGTGKVADQTYAELAELDNAYWFTSDCTCRDRPDGDYTLRGVRTGDTDPPEGYTADDFVIPRFEDIAERYPDHLLNIEIKGSYPDAVPAADELARVLTDLDRLDSAVVTSFDDEVADAFHRAAPDVEITPGLGAMTAYVLQQVKPPDGRRILQIPPDYEGLKVLTPELVERTKADGFVLWIWPNEQKWENATGYRELLDMGVGGINAADPVEAVDTLEAWLDEQR